jgi:hypothetical protein
MLDSGQLQRYVEEFSIKAAEAADLETLFFELAIEDLRRARKACRRSNRRRSPGCS